MTDVLEYGNYFFAALTIGLSCGTGCSPIITIFLSSYLFANSSNIAKSIYFMLSFFMGKMIAIITLSIISSILGHSIIDDSGKLFGIDSGFILDILMILTGIVLLISIFYKNINTKRCGSCKCTSNENNQKSGRSKIPVFLVGIGYGLKPCAPLIMILLISTVLTPVKAALTSSVFVIASSISPFILLAILAGFLSKKMHTDIPNATKVFQIISCFIFISLGLTSFIMKITI